jgi:flagellar hook-associated protein 3 FlgL
MLSSFYPVVAGRTSDSLSRNRSLYQVQVGKIGIQQLEDQLSSGKRFSLPSQDPTAAIRVIGIQREIEFRDQTLRNLDSSQGYLNVTESTLSNVQDVLTEVRGLGVESAGNLSSESERQGWISQVNAAIDRHTSAANTRYQDRFIFTGGEINTETVKSLGTTVQFTGDDNNLLTIANSGEYIAHNVTGQKAFGLVSEGKVSTVDLAPAALSSTRLADLNGGQGVTPGAIQFSNGLERVSVDLADADTVADILSKINGVVKLSGRDVQATVSNGSLVFTYTDGDTGILNVQESGAGRTAADLGVLSSTPTPLLPIVGNSLDPVLRPTTQLSQLNDGAGFDASQGFRIEQNGKVYVIDISAANTIEDVTNTINASGASVRADITPDGRSLRVRSTQSGADLSIGENGGGLAERLGLRTFTAQTRVDQINYNRGISTGNAADISILRNDGSDLQVDLDGSTTIQDVLDRINSHASNQDPATKVTASLNAQGNGITLSSEAYVPDPLGPPLTTTPGPIVIRATGGSQAAWDLGLLPPGQSQIVSTTSGTSYTITGKDPNPQEVKGVFNSLIRLREAIQSNDPAAVGRAVELIDTDLDRLSLSRGSLGVQQQRIDDLINLQEENKIDLKADESKNLDADLASTISELTGRQAAYEASLKLLASASQLSLFSFL